MAHNEVTFENIHKWKTNQYTKITKISYERRDLEVLFHIKKQNAKYLLLENNIFQMGSIIVKAVAHPLHSVLHDPSQNI